MVYWRHPQAPFHLKLPQNETYKTMYKDEEKIIDTPMGQSTVGEMLPFFIVIGVGLVLIIICIRMIAVTSKMKQEQKKAVMQKKANGATVMLTCPHVNGLPIAENILCQITSYPDKLTIEANHNQFNLEKNKITDICIKTDTEIHQQ